MPGSSPDRPSRAERTARRRRPLREETFAAGESEVRAVVLFSDAVFAIAITLLALEITVPEIPKALVHRELPHAVAELAPKFIAYVIGFLVIGLQWIAYHRDVRYIDRFDTPLVQLNLLLLFFIAFLPFPTALMGAYGDERIAVIFFAAATVGVSATLFVFWLIGSARAGPRVPPHVRTEYALRSLTVAVVFAVSIGIAFISPNAARYSWAAAFVLRGVVRRVYRRSGAG